MRRDVKPGWSFVRNVIIKSALLFIILNALFAVIYPMDALASLTIYNWLVPGRQRLPHGDVPEKAFNLTTSNLEAMFRSHVISKSRSDEFRIVVIGDSSVWGFLLEPQQTFTSKLNSLNLRSVDGRSARFYNLGYPTLSTTKDLLILKGALRYEPDLILWFVTLESLPKKTQLESPLLHLNAKLVNQLIGEVDLGEIGPLDSISAKTLWDRTLIGSRLELSELLRLQLYGFAWAATGVDHYIPKSYNERMVDLTLEESYKGFERGAMSEGDLQFEALEAAIRMAAGIPIVFVNEPIFISDGVNSEIRYNFFYPRWAYDKYRKALNGYADSRDWQYLDLWDELPPAVFTDSAIHYSERGAEMVADRIFTYLQTSVADLESVE